MPDKPLKECSSPACHNLTKDKYCKDHSDTDKKNKIDRDRYNDKRRGSASSRGYDSKWTKARAAYLRANPFCENHKIKMKRCVMANVVDHIIPHNGDDGLFWDRDNWQSLCTQCHNQKTAREDGGFGNKVRGGRV